MQVEKNLKRLLMSDVDTQEDKWGYFNHSGMEINKSQIRV